MKGIATTSKGETRARAPADLVRSDPETDRVPTSHNGNHGNHVISETVHGRMVTITKDQNPWRNDSTTMPPWTP